MLSGLFTLQHGIIRFYYHYVPKSFEEQAEKM